MQEGFKPGGGWYIYSVCHLLTERCRGDDFSQEAPEFCRSLAEPLRALDHPLICIKRIIYTVGSAYTDAGSSGPVQSSNNVSSGIPHSVTGYLIELRPLTLQQ